MYDLSHSVLTLMYLYGENSYFCGLSNFFFTKYDNVLLKQEMFPLRNIHTDFVVIKSAIIWIWYNGEHNRAKVTRNAQPAEWKEKWRSVEARQLNSKPNLTNLLAHNGSRSVCLAGTKSVEWLLVPANFQSHNATEVRGAGGFSMSLKAIEGTTGEDQRRHHHQVGVVWSVRWTRVHVQTKQTVRRVKKMQWSLLPFFSGSSSAAKSVTGINILRFSDEGISSLAAFVLN